MLPLYPRLFSHSIFAITLPLYALLALLATGAASAAVVGGTATTFTGDGAPLSVLVSIDDAADPGNLVITLEVDSIDCNIGDLRGFFAHVSDESLLSGLSVTGSDVTSSEFDANNVIKVGGGNTMNGGGTPCKCDLGIELGTPGIGKDDLQTVTFTLSHATANLDVSLFSGMDFGVRATSVGSGSSRNGSSKTAGTIVPEPTTALMMALGLGGLAAGARRTQAS